MRVSKVIPLPFPQAILYVCESLRQPPDKSACKDTWCLVYLKHVCCILAGGSLPLCVTFCAYKARNGPCGGTGEHTSFAAASVLSLG